MHSNDLKSIDVDKGFFRSQENDEELFGPEVPHLNVIGSLMYLANYTRSDIVFILNLLSKILFFTYKKTLDWSKTYTLLP